MTGLTDPMVGRVVLNRYRIVRVLAHGGMGVLYIGRTEGAAGFSRPAAVVAAPTGSSRRASTSWTPWAR